MSRTLICKNLRCPTQGNLALAKFRECPSRGDVTCTRCGRVCEDKTFLAEEEMRSFSEEESKARTSAVSNYFEDLSTTVAHTPYNPNPSADKLKSLPRQLQADSKTKALLQAKDALAEFCAKLDIPPMVEEKARFIFKEYIAPTKRKPTGANSDSMTLAILYMALKEAGFARPFNELAAVSKDENPLKSLKNCYSKLLKVIPQKKAAVGTSSSSDLVSRYAVDVSFPQNLKTIAVDVAAKASLLLTGRQPSTVAAASLLFTATVSGFALTAREISKATACATESTIKSAFNILQNHKTQLLPSDFDTLVAVSSTKPTPPSHSTSSYTVKNTPALAFTQPTASRAKPTQYVVPQTPMPVFPYSVPTSYSQPNFVSTPYSQFPYTMATQTTSPVWDMHFNVPACASTLTPANYPHYAVGAGLPYYNM